MQQQPEITPNPTSHLKFTKHVQRDIQGSEVRHRVSGVAEDDCGGGSSNGGSSADQSGY